MIPSVTTKKWMIDSVAERWRRQYQYDENSKYGKGKWKWEDKEITYRGLLALENKTEDSIARVIGNNSWTRLVCDQCKQDKPALVTVGAEPDYDSSTARLCLECLKVNIEAVELELKTI